MNPREREPLSMDASAARSARGLGLGLVLVGVSALALWFSRDIQGVTLGAGHDPGPRLFPVSLTILLGALGVIELWLSRSQISNFKFELAEGWREQGMLIAALAGYLVLLHTAGFGLATLMFSVLTMRLLGTTWRLAGVAGLVLVVSVHLLFVRLFKVPLPTGLLGMPL